ncbi:rpsA, partial [Symbiodinium pilosum]
MPIDTATDTARKGFISAFNDAGDLVAIDVGAEVEGFAHVSVLADEFVDNPRELFEIGEEVEAVVTNIECSGTEGKPLHRVVPRPSAETKSQFSVALARSRARLRPRPPDDAEEQVEVGKSYEGIVSHVRDDGFHVVLGDGRAGYGNEGFLHLSKMPGYHASAYKVAKVCDKVKVKVLHVDHGSRGPRIELSWDKPAATLRPARKPGALQSLGRGEWLKGTVYNIKKFGIFVEVPTEDGPCQGMVHISEVRE